MLSLLYDSTSCICVFICYRHTHTHTHTLTLSLSLSLALSLRQDSLADNMLVRLLWHDNRATLNYWLKDTRILNCDLAYANQCLFSHNCNEHCDVYYIWHSISVRVVQKEQGGLSGRRPRGEWGVNFLEIWSWNCMFQCILSSIWKFWIQQTQLKQTVF